MARLRRGWPVTGAAVAVLLAASLTPPLSCAQAQSAAPPPRTVDGFVPGSAGAALEAAKLSQLSADAAKTNDIHRAYGLAVRVLALMPNDPTAVSNYESLRHAEAVRLTEEAQIALNNGGKIDAAVDLLQRALELIPDDPKAKSNLDAAKARRDVLQAQSAAAQAASNTFAYTVCNNAGEAVFVATSYRDAAQGWVRQGWWRVEDGACTNLGRYPKGTFYYFADGASGGEWSGDFGLCLPQEGFKRVNTSGDCQSGEKLRKFQTLNITTDTYTTTLRGVVPNGALPESSVGLAGNQAAAIYDACSHAWNQNDFANKPGGKAMVGGTKPNGSGGLANWCYARWSYASVNDAVADGLKLCKADAYECFVFAKDIGLVPWAAKEMNNAPRRRQPSTQAARSGGGGGFPSVGSLLKGFTFGLGAAEAMAGAVTGRQDLVENGTNVMGTVASMGSGGATGYTPPPSVAGGGPSQRPGNCDQILRQAQEQKRISDNSGALGKKGYDANAMAEYNNLMNYYRAYCQ